MWAELVERYLTSLREQGRRPHTVRGYRGDLEALARSLATGEGVRGWTVSLEDLALTTRARRLSAARGFLCWARAQGAGVEGIELLDLPVGYRQAPRAPADKGPAVEAVLKAIPLQADRDQLLFKLMALAGLRPGEVLALNLEDFDPATGHLRVHGWGGSTRSVFIDAPELALRLAHWSRATGRESGPMFCAPGRSAPLHYQSVLEHWRRYTQKAGLDVRLGDLRLHHAAQLLAGGVPEWAVRERLGTAHGPLPWPGDDADEQVRAWRRRLERSEPASPPPDQAGPDRLSAG